MIRGRYVRGDNFVEVYRGNGITEIMPAQQYDPHTEQGLSYFWWPHERVGIEVNKKDRSWIWWTVGAAVFLLGASFGAILQEIYYCVPLFVISLAYIGLVVYANKK